MPGARADQTSTSSFEPITWVPRFRSITSRTRFVHLPAEYLAVALTGAVYTADNSSDRAANQATQTEVEWSDGTVDVVPAAAHSEADEYGIEAAIEEGIATLGGAVCPKFGTACPVDATWANFHRSTKCTSAGDVLTLLQSSERVMATVAPGGGLSLALRKWADLDGRMEFRCFVRGGRIVGVCPRVPENMVEYGEEDMDRHVMQLSHWFDARVKETFEGPSEYALDVYIDRQARTWVIDFAAWGGTTDSLLFAWEELEHASWMSTHDRAQFRCAYRHAAIRPSQRVYDGLPLELRHPDAFASVAEAARRLAVEEGVDDSDDEWSAGGEE